MSASVGCALLTSCGGGAGGAGTDGTTGVGPPVSTALPNGYRFFPLYTPGDRGLKDVAFLSPMVMLDESNHVLFGGQKANGQMGLYQLTVDYAGAPRVVDVRAIATAGSAMPDGRVISHLISVDVSDAGHVAAAIDFDLEQGPKGQGPAAVVLDRGRGLETVLDYGQEVAGNQGTFGGAFGDVDLTDKGLMVVARYGADGDTPQGLFYLPAVAPAAARVLASSGQEVPEANGSIDSIGLIDQDDDGDYVIQAFGSNPRVPKNGGPPPGNGSVIIKGHVDSPISQGKLLASCPSLSLTRAASRAGAQPATGASFFGPRIGGPNLTSHITASGDVQTLYRGSVPLVWTGQRSPAGSRVVSILSAVINDLGLMFYQLVTDDGIELCIHNGAQTATILSRGSEVAGYAVDTIAFGFHTTQVDPLGRLVCYAQMQSGQELVLLGVPV